MQTLLEAAGAAAALKEFLPRAHPPATPSRALLREHPAPGPGTRRTIACTFRLRSAAASRAARSARAACCASYCARAVSSPTTCSSQPLRGHPDATGHIASVRRPADLECVLDSAELNRRLFCFFWGNLVRMEPDPQARSEFAPPRLQDTHEQRQGRPIWRRRRRVNSRYCVPATRHSQLATCESR